MEIVAIGTSQFLLGFSLAGIEKTILATKETILDLVYQQQGIVLLDERLTNHLTFVEREQLETSIDPVVLSLGEKGDQQIARLQRAVKETLGVDLL